MGELMLLIDILGVKVYQISIYFFAVVPNESVLLVALEKVEMLFE
jgi:hypothetical protein